MLPDKTELTAASWAFVEKLDEIVEGQECDQAKLLRIENKLSDLEELIKRLGTMLNNVHGRLNSLETQLANLALRDCPVRTPVPPYHPMPQDAYADWIRRTKMAQQTRQRVAEHCGVQA